MNKEDIKYYLDKLGECSETLTEWEVNFLASIESLFENGVELSIKQKDTLVQIYDRRVK